MDTGVLIASVVGILGVLIAGFGLLLQVRSSTAADKAKAVTDKAAEIAAAVAVANESWRVRVDDLQRDLDAERDRANRQEARADGLQLALINRNGGGS